MERLIVQVIWDIIYRLRSGQSVRAIARDIGHSRETVRKYRDLAEAEGYLDADRELPDTVANFGGLGPAIRVSNSNVSSVEPYRDVVKGLVDQGVEMVAIHRRLVRNHGYTGSYTSVRRFVRHLKPKGKEVVVRIETAPGAQAQVDFGGAGKLGDRATGKERQAYCFVMTLSYSRHQYVELVFDQKMETWIGCHRRAFESFGGTPRELVIDNLKAAVIQAALDNPILSEPYRRMAQHYGIIVHPCRPGAAAHKGKVENGVHYVQRNFLAGSEFLDIEEANEKVKVWVVEEAGIRDHGTTHEMPLRRFYEEEQAALLPLPREPFELLSVRQATLHRDCHVEIDGSYYSAPFIYVGKKLDAYVYERVVQIYNGVELLVTHPKATRRGERVTRMEHYPPDKSVYLLRTRGYCQQKATMIGPSCAKVVGELLSERPLDRLRSVQGIIGLGEKYGERRLEAACARVLHYGDPSYRRVKRILEAGLDREYLAPSPAQQELRFYEYARPASEFFAEHVLNQVEREASRC